MGGPPKPERSIAFTNAGQLQTMASLEEVYSYAQGESLDKNMFNSLGDAWLLKRKENIIGTGQSRSREKPSSTLLPICKTV